VENIVNQRAVTNSKTHLKIVTLIKINCMNMAQ